MEGSSVAPFQEFYRKLKGTLPSGPLWDAYRAAIGIDSAMLRTVAMPPNSPKPAIEALRKALAQVNNDPEYAEEAIRIMKFVPFYVSEGDVNARARKQMSITPEVRAFVVSYMKEAGHK
jgi:tripartite-type tricarboxylate transporter receptor subunit TctC